MYTGLLELTGFLLAAIWVYTASYHWLVAANLDAQLIQLHTNPSFCLSQP